MTQAFLGLGHEDVQAAVEHVAGGCHRAAWIEPWLTGAPYWQASPRPDC